MSARCVSDKLSVPQKMAHNDILISRFFPSSPRKTILHFTFRIWDRIEKQMFFIEREDIFCGTFLISNKGDATECKSARSEEHTSELQSQSNLVCRLLL